MKYRLTVLGLVMSFLVNAQTNESVINVPYNSNGSTRKTLLYKPDDYSSTTTSYPILIFLHGAGESTTSLSSIYNNSGAGGPAYFIENGQWPASFTNPADGKAYK